MLPNRRQAWRHQARDRNGCFTAFGLFSGAYTTQPEAMIDRVAVLLLAGSALFGAMLLGELNADDPGVQPAVTPSPAPAPMLQAQRQQSPRIDELVATTLSRPLFSATRRPAERMI